MFILVYAVLLFLCFFVGSLFFVSQYVIPVKTKDERTNIFSRLLVYIMGGHGPALSVKEGKVLEREGETKKTGPGVMRVDLNSAIVIERLGRQHPSQTDEEKSTNRLAKSHRVSIRVAGPGLVFTDYYERLRGVVDLRPQMRLRLGVKAYTRDGIEFTSHILSIFTLGQPPQVLKVAYEGERDADHLRVAYLKESDSRLDPYGRVIATVKLADELDADDKAEIHRFVQSYMPDAILNQPDGSKQKTPFLVDHQRIFAAVYSKTKDVTKDTYLDWQELTPNVTAEVFRTVLGGEFFNDLYRPEDPEVYRLKDLKARVARQVRNMGVLAYQYVGCRDEQPLFTGQTIPKDELVEYPVQEFRTPKVLRSRGIKVISASFTEPKPVDKELLRQKLYQYWASKWEANTEITKAGHDLQAMRIRSEARVRAQQSMIKSLSDILNQEQLSREALAIRLYQSLEAASTEPTTRKLLPEDTVAMLRSFKHWLLPGQGDQEYLPEHIPPQA